METAATMAQRALMPGTPLRTLAVVMAARTDLLQADMGDGAAGAAPAAPGQPAAPAAPAAPGLLGGGGGSGAYGPLAGGSPTGSGSYGAPPAAAAAGGGFNPMGLLANWRQNLAILASNRSPGDAELLTRLGERLLAGAHQVEAAHAAFLLAGLPPQPLGPGGEGLLALLGGDHRAAPRTYANALSLQRTEVYEWARAAAPDAAAPGPLHCLLPYRLVYAGLLAEAGLVSEAVAYCDAVDKVRRRPAAAPHRPLKLCSAQPGRPGRPGGPAHRRPARPAPPARRRCSRAAGCRPACARACRCWRTCARASTATSSSSTSPSRPPTAAARCCARRAPCSTAGSTA
jgi:hypothetical protein